MDQTLTGNEKIYTEFILEVFFLMHTALGVTKESMKYFEEKCGFEFKIREDNKYCVLEDSFINNSCIDKCYVVEAYNKTIEKNELFIAKKHLTSLVHV